MNSFDCNIKILVEAIFIGSICLVIGKLAFYLSTNKNDRDNKEKQFPNLNLVLFITGFILHFIIENIGLNKWYCDKKCMTGLKFLSKI
jgi:hypothetical protein